MRGGSIPVAAWGVLLTILFVGNWIWDAKAVNAATAAFAAVLIFVTAALLAWRGRAALRPGPPERDPRPEPVPQVSAGAALAAFGVASIVFGVEFGNFAIYFGAAVLVAALGRVVRELRAERRTQSRIIGERRP